MKEWFRTLCLGMGIVSYVGSTGCASITPTPPLPSTPVSISTFESVAGKWAGILKRRPPSRKDDWVTVTIHRDGAYHFESVRTIGLMQGEGTFALTDGTLRVETGRGWIMATLYEEEGRRMLSVMAEATDGVKYSADLTPTK